MPLSIETVLERLTTRPPRVVGDATPDWRHAAVAAVFRPGPGGAELLFIRRAVHDEDPWSGQIGFPGGRAEEGDEGPMHTAARETREELGLDLLDPDRARSLGPLDQLQARARRQVLAMAITPWAFLHHGPVPDLRPNVEVDEAFWVPLADLADPARRVWHDAHRAEVPYTFAGIELGRGPDPLWGLTHYMTVEILFRLGLVEDVDALTRPRSRVG